MKQVFEAREGAMDDIRDALEAVVKEAKNGAAINYAKAALNMGGSKDVCLVETDRLPGAVFVGREETGKMLAGNDLRIQLLYVLNNLHGWRGQRAREVKEALRRGTV